jgi:hypothetical protein
MNPPAIRESEVDLQNKSDDEKKKKKSTVSQGCSELPTQLEGCP